ncbi:ras family small GTPase [Reticulomyxa filosa]|uniref:Ras family small GTPase n=1 Tax=Reticulomyxa filosa TaxID=46433 RepID=X6MSQ0_RETFI|nr:ras family small GTPase [Reticulomyxa filosa]|eukprot:ETO16462.1 ras family small GTPase [Reticulomyxa filosa]
MAEHATNRSFSQSTQGRETEPDFYVGVFGTSKVNNQKESKNKPKQKGMKPDSFPFNTYTRQTNNTNMDSYRKIFPIGEQRLLLDILDTAGQEEFASLQDSWIRTRDAFLLVMAYGDFFENSWRCVEHYISKLQKSTNGNISSLPIVIAANRIDEFAPPDYVDSFFFNFFFLVNLHTYKKFKKKKKKEKTETQITLCAEVHLNFFFVNLHTYTFCTYVAFFLIVISKNQKLIVMEFVEKNHFEYVELTASNKEQVKECFKSLIESQNKLLALEGSRPSAVEEKPAAAAAATTRAWNQLVECFQHNLIGESVEDDRQLDFQKRLRLTQISEKNVPPDKISLPILSLKEYTIIRRFRRDVLVKSLLYGCILPLRLLWQVVAFLTFSPEKLHMHIVVIFCTLHVFKKKKYIYIYLYTYINYEQLLIKFPRDLDYTRPEAISYDLLGLVVGRAAENSDEKEKQHEAARNYRWFLSQSKAQLVQRFILFVVASGLFGLVLFHLYYASVVVYYDSNVSVIETAGPFCLYVVFWVLFSVWISYDVVVDPPLASWQKLGEIELYFGEHF